MARARKLSTRWSLQAVHELMSDHGVFEQGRLVGYGKRAVIGDFVVIKRHADADVRGVLLSVTRCSRPRSSLLSNDGYTTRHVVIQADPLDVHNMDTHNAGPTSFYLHKLDRVVGVTAGYAVHVYDSVKASAAHAVAHAGK